MISAHFSRKEFACMDGCGFAAVDVELVGLLEKVRAYFGGLPVKIHCACRCQKHNREIGSEDTSQHVRGMAVDFHIDTVANEDIYEYVDKQLLPGRGGAGIYEWGVHMDVRDGFARWDNRNKGGHHG